MNAPPIDIFFLAGLLVLTLGIVLLAAYRIWTRLRSLEVAGWVLTFLGLSMVFTPVVAVLFCGTFAELFRQRRVMRQYGLLSLITVAAERSIPLAPAIEAFAQEYRGRWRRQARTLAAMLAAGTPLPEAVKRLPGLLPAEALPLIVVGCESGNLPAALRKAAAGRMLFQPLWQAVLAKIFYLSLLPLFGTACFMFLVIMVRPPFERIYMDFDLPLPRLFTVVFNSIPNFLASTGLGILLVVVLVFGLLYVWLRCLGTIRWNPPGLRRFLRRLDGALVLDSLSLVVGQNWPLTSAIGALVPCCPNADTRRRLRKTVSDMNQGVDWADSLAARGLIGRADRAILRAAGRAGNLSWAMEEMAEGNRRRVAYRVQFLLQAIFPLVIVVYGLITMLVVAGLFVCLPTLILHLA